MADNSEVAVQAPLPNGSPATADGNQSQQVSQITA